MSADLSLLPIGVMSKGIAEIPGIEAWLGDQVVRARFGRFWQPISAVAGWGHKSTAQQAMQYANAHQLPYLSLEDGFIRSIGLGPATPSQAMIIDDIGVYYDATTPSRFERLATQRLSNEKSQRAQALIAQWRAARVSKYNHLREYSRVLPNNYVLVADQTRGDASVIWGLADRLSFSQMLEAAQREYPECTVLIKIHPAVKAGLKRGYFDIEKLSNNPRLHFISDDVHPTRLLENATAVFTVTSQIGFEALLWGKPVHCFGMPFYAGWGLTHDSQPAPDRRKPIILEQLAHAALVEYARYRHPETQEACEVEELIEWVRFQRSMRARFATTLYAIDFSWNKKPSVERFLAGSSVQFVKHESQIPKGAAIVVWGSREVTRADLTVVRLEDGFVRSVGLGADLIRPTSWVADQTGIYYDATGPSDLENTLQNFKPDQRLLERAKQLHAKIIGSGISKYNLGGKQWTRPANGKRVILVPGQVETDASIVYGAPVIRTNIDLVRAVLEANPKAYIVYKPHPDVVAGLRHKGELDDTLTGLCDEVLTDVSIHHLLNEVDEVHVMTSLTGFEALLRGRTVVTYGQPFYSGWGLTVDKLVCERRTRKLSVTELVAGTLILYPSYRDKNLDNFASPEYALERMLELQTTEVAFKAARAWGRRWVARLTTRRR